MAIPRRPERRSPLTPTVLPQVSEASCPRCGNLVKVNTGCGPCSYREGGGIWTRPPGHDETHG